MRAKRGEDSANRQVAPFPGAAGMGEAGDLNLLVHALHCFGAIPSIPSPQ
jgi:hypothetical protein